MTDLDDEILIGEGVALNTGAAPVTMRMVSGVIDIIVYLVPFIVVDAYFDITSRATFEGGLWGVLAITNIVLFLVIVPTVVETLTRGYSAGRAAMGLRVVRDDGGPISARHALGRAGVGLFEVFASLGVLAVVTSMLSARGKRIGDVISGTYAMRTRGQQTMLPPAAMPPHLREWASNADMARLPDGLALTARMFLGRAPSMHQPSRVRIGQQLSTQLSQYVSPHAPTGTTAEEFIAAVIAARRDREYARESRQSIAARNQAEAMRTLPYGIADTDN